MLTVNDEQMPNSQLAQALTHQSNRYHRQAIGPTPSAIDALRLTDLLAWPTLGQQLFAPALSLLADPCGLSIAQLQHALPRLLTAISYQLLVRLGMTSDGANLVQDVAYQQQCGKRLQGWLAELTSEAVSVTQGLTFKKIEQLQPHVASVHGALFRDAVRWYLLLGALAAQTGLPLAAIERLMPWVTTLSLTGLRLFLLELDHNEAPDRAACLGWWIVQQPLWLHASADSTLAQISGFEHTINAQQRHKLARQPLQNTHANLLTQQLNALIALKPFGVMPVWVSGLPAATPNRVVNPTAQAQGTATTTNTNSKTNTNTNSNTNANTNAGNNTISNLATPKPWANIAVIKRPVGLLLERLQTYWIATATVLSIIVFGSLAWAFGGFAYQSLFSNTVDNTTAKAVTKNPVTYQDVAIMRVASVTSAEKIPSNTADTPQAEESKIMPKVTTTQKATVKKDNLTATTDKNKAKDSAKPASDKDKPSKGKVAKHKQTDENKHKNDDSPSTKPAKNKSIPRKDDTTGEKKAKSSTQKTQTTGSKSGDKQKSADKVANKKTADTADKKGTKKSTTKKVTSNKASTKD